MMDTETLLIRQDLASRGARLGAHLLDGLALIGAAIPGLLLMLVAEETYDEELFILGGLLLGGGMLALAIYQIYLLSSRGQTIGKRALSIQIVMHDDESNPGFFRAVVLRILLPGIIIYVAILMLEHNAPDLIEEMPWFGNVFYLANILFIFAEDRRCIHDHIAGTKVVDFGGNAPVTTRRIHTTPTYRPMPTYDPPPPAFELPPIGRAPEPEPYATSPMPLSLDDFLIDLGKANKLYLHDVLTEEEYRRRKDQIISKLARWGVDAAPEDVLREVMRLRESDVLDDEDVTRIKDLVL